MSNNIIKVSYTYAKLIFDNLPLEKFNKLLFTDESIYSSSKVEGSQLLKKIIYENLTDENITITDGTANIGTDSIYLSNYFKNVNSIEISNINHKALVNNINVFEKSNIRPILGDVIVEINKLEQDVIYIDAPWGGRSYKKNENMKLYLGNMEILDFYKSYKNKAKIFVFKIPYNYNFEYLKNNINDKIIIYPFKKEDKIKFFFIVIY
jgi:16S rRNA G966 N2-methylase RsmD